MKVYKEKQYLVFDFEDGKTVKYDFATKEAIGKKGYVVDNLKNQLRGLTIKDIIEHCSDKNYADFLRYVMREYSNKSLRSISNIGTVLYHIPEYANIEQLFSAGVTNVNHDFKYRISDLPSGLIKLCRKYGKDGLMLTNNLAGFYKQNPDAYNIAFSNEYAALTINDLFSILTYSTHVWINDHGANVCLFLRLINQYGYNAKSLLLYIDHLKTFEAMEDMQYLLRELSDYCNIMSQISEKFEKYPKHFLTTHRIATRNYNRLKKDFDDAAFAKRVNPEMEYTYKGYKFIYPRSVDDIKDEAVQQNNCVASYIDRVIKGSCDILFLRREEALDKSLVTLEVRDGRICQSRQHYNYPCTAAQNEAIEAWNRWYEKKMKNVA